MNFKKILFIGLLIGAAGAASAQMKTPLSPPSEPVEFDPASFSPAVQLGTGLSTTNPWSGLPLQSLDASKLSQTASENGRYLFSSLSENGFPRAAKVLALPAAAKVENTQDQALAVLNDLREQLKLNDQAIGFDLLDAKTDDLGFDHFKFQQTYLGVPIEGAEYVLHSNGQRIHFMNGQLSPAFAKADATPTVDTADLVGICQEALEVITAKVLTKSLVWRQSASSMDLVYAVDVMENMLHRWTIYVDAKTGAVIHRRLETCSFMPTFGDLPKGDINVEHTHVAASQPHVHKAGEACSSPLAALLPPTTASARDLNNVTRTINVFQQNGSFFLLDASRPMFNTNSNIPDDPQGAVWTIDAQNQPPDNDGQYNLRQNSSTNNTWTPLQVSAHYNAGTSYDYFLSTHGRNSINGTGGNVLSIINVTEDGSGLDNAFWNGFAMFYGNGGSSFSSPLARALDVAGHEMSHGVIQKTANLVYEVQSGSLNESFADIFGVLIDDANWKLGEDVVNPNVFRSGALRDMENPNQGGSSLSDRGWQPQHMNEFQTLPNTPNGNNGGVHINSGIPNRAFFLFATQVGRDKAGQVYYRALDNYLTKNSQFIDCRIAVIQAATDLYGAGSTEVQAATSAFDQVGIGAGSGTSTQQDIPSNGGQELLMVTSQDYEGIFVFQGNDPNAIQISDTGLRSKPSVSDNGSIIVFVADDNTIRVLELNASTNTYEESFLENDPQTIWRNVAISKDGNRLAALTTNNDNTIFVFDFISGQGQNFELYNPTTATTGIQSDDVEYADILEFAYDGEYLMYDAYNVLADNFGNAIDYWDIGFLRYWNASTNNFGDGFISKLFNGLPENSSVGNPTFAKNSPFIIAFDFLEDGFFGTDYSLYGANTETGDVALLYENSSLAYPSYSLNDNLIYFEEEGFSDVAVKVIPVAANKIQPAGNASDAVSGARWAGVYGLGNRTVNTTEQQTVELTISPNPTQNRVQITLPASLNSRSKVEINLFNMNGQLVKSQQEAFATDLQFDLGDLPQGAYLLRLSANDFSAKQLIIKQ